MTGTGSGTAGLIPERGKGLLWRNGMGHGTDPIHVLCKEAQQEVLGRKRANPVPITGMEWSP